MALTPRRILELMAADGLCGLREARHVAALLEAIDADSTLASTYLLDRFQRNIVASGAMSNRQAAAFCTALSTRAGGSAASDSVALQTAKRRLAVKGAGRYHEIQNIIDNLLLKAVAGGAGIYELDDDGTVAGLSGYLHLNMNVDNQSFDQTLTASDGANIYFGINSDPFGTGKITVGSDIIAIGFTITANTGSALNLATAGVLGGFGVIWNAGVNNYTVNHLTTSGSNRNHRASPVWNNTTPGDGGLTQTYANLVSKDYKYILYFNGTTKRIGRAYYNYLTNQWVDQGYDSVDVFVDGISPFVFVDNDAAAVAGLDGTVQSGSLKTDATWLSQALSVLPAGCKTFDGTVIA